MRRLLTTSILLALVAMPSTSAVSLARTGANEAPAQRLDDPPMVASLAVTRLPSQRELKVKVDTNAVTLVPVFLHDANTKNDRLFILSDKGEVIGDDISALEDFFRCRRSGRTHTMHPEILAVLAEISSAYPGHVIEVVSGYRRRGFGVKRSKHFTGNAIDLRVRGVKTSEIRDFLWSGQEEARGVGHYRHEDFVHVDYRPREAKVGWTQGRRNSSYHFNPKWARI